MGVAPWVHDMPRAEAVTLYEVLACLPPAERATLARYLDLTPRQQQVCLLTARGMRRRQIADILCVTEQTVGNHQVEIYLKLDIPQTGNGNGQSRRMLALRCFGLGRAIEACYQDGSSM